MNHDSLSIPLIYFLRRRTTVARVQKHALRTTTLSDSFGLSAIPLDPPILTSVLVRHIVQS